MGFPRLAMVSIKIFCSIISIFIFIMDWRKYRRIIKYGGCYDATVVGFKGSFFPYPIVQFDVNGKVVEDKLSCGTAQNPELGSTIKVYYWQEYYDEIISEIDSDITPHYIMIIFIAIVVFTLWTLA